MRVFTKFCKAHSESLLDGLRQVGAAVPRLLVEMGGGTVLGEGPAGGSSTALCERLKHETSEKDKYRSLLRELLDAQRNRKSEQLSKDQLALFEKLWNARHPEEECQKDAEPPAGEEAKPEKTPVQKRSGRQPLARHLVRERVVHDLAESEKHCNGCGYGPAREALPPRLDMAPLIRAPEGL
jgi:hypothetical protein